MKTIRHITNVFFFLTLTAPVFLHADRQSDLRDRVIHVMNRFGYGPRPDEVDDLVKKGDKGLEKYVQSQLNPEKISDEVTDALLNRQDILKMSTEELLKNYNKDAKESDGTKGVNQIRKAWASAKIMRAVLSERQMQERLVDFWYNHFNVDQRKGKDRWLFASYERDTIRPHVFGSFYDLLRATARDPAMLFYLDNHLSQGENVKAGGGKKGSGLNENYARELMELHTLGVNGGYTQKDVREVAKILTGWSIADINEAPQFKFKERIHDVSAKKVMNWDFPAGHGEDEGERLLKLLAEHPSTAKFISTKLVEAFVATPAPQSLVDHLSKTFLQSHGDLKTVYNELIHSNEFWSPANRRTLVKDHFTWVVSAVRSMNGEVIFKNQLVEVLNQLGQPLFQCAPPTGYRSSPENYVNAGSLVARLNLSLKLAANRVEGVYITPVDLTLQASTNENEFVQKFIKAMDVPRLSDNSVKALKDELSAGVWKLNSHQARPFVQARMMGILLATPEFQRN